MNPSGATALARLFHNDVENPWLIWEPVAGGVPSPFR